MASSPPLPPHPGARNESQQPVQAGQAPTQLEFTQAMTDFKGIVVI